MDVPSVASLREDFAAVLEVVSAGAVTESDHSSILTLWGNFTRKIGQLIESKTTFEQNRRAALQKLSLRDSENKLKRLIDIDQELDVIQNSADPENPDAVATQLLVLGLIEECTHYVSVLKAISTSYINRPVITRAPDPVSDIVPPKPKVTLEHTATAAAEVFGTDTPAAPPVEPEKKTRKRKIELPADIEPESEPKPDPQDTENQSTFQKLMARKA